MKKRVLFAAMLLCAVFLLIAACGRTDDPAEAGTTLGDAQAAAPTFDFGGRVIRITNPWGPMGTNLERGMSADGDLFLDRIAEVEEMLNVQVEIFRGPDGYWDIVVPSILAGEPFAEIKFSFPWQFINWYLAGAVKDITDLFDWNDPDIVPSITDIATLGGRKFGIGVDTPNFESALIFNKRLLEEAGLESPFDLVDQGRWDFATLREYARILTTSTDGTGVINQWGLGSPYISNLFHTAVFSAGGQWADVSVSPPRIMADSPATMDGLNFVNDMHNIDGSILVPPPGEGSAFGIAAFVNGQVAMLVAPAWVIDSVNAGDMTDTFGVVPFAMGPRATDFVTPVLPHPWVIPVTSDDELARATLHTFVELFRPLHPELTLEERLTIAAMGMVHDERSLENVVRLRTDWAVANPTGMVGMGGLISEVINGILDQVGTPASIINAGIEAAQIYVNERFGG